MLTDDLPVLSESAQAVWQAYNAMEMTKQRHFDYMSYLERKHKQYNLVATEKETNFLARLLSDHNNQVNSFKNLNAALREQDEEAFNVYIQYLTIVNKLMAPLSSDSH